MKHLKLLARVFDFSAERYLRSAGDLFAFEGDYEAALAMIDKTLALSPRNERALVLKADILFCLNDDAAALRLLNQAIEAHPDRPEAYASKAGVLDALGKPREALQCCDLALSLIGRAHDYLLAPLLDQKLSLLIQIRRHRQALRLLNEASKLLNDDEYGYLQMCYRSALTQACRQRRRPASAASHLALCPTIAPEDSSQTLL